MAWDTISGKRLAAILMPTVLLSGLFVGCDAKKSIDPQFSAGRQALMQGQYAPAIQKLQGYLRDKPNGGLASRASFLIAKTHLGLGKYEESRKQFEQTTQQYPDTEEAHKARYKLAVLSLIEGDREDARRRFTELTENPSGTLTPESAAMLRYVQQLDSDAALGEL